MTPSSPPVLIVTGSIEMAVSPDGTVYVANGNTNSVSVLSLVPTPVV